MGSGIDFTLRLRDAASGVLDQVQAKANRLGTSVDKLSGRELLGVWTELNSRISLVRQAMDGVRNAYQRAADAMAKPLRLAAEQRVAAAESAQGPLGDRMRALKAGATSARGEALVAAMQRARGQYGALPGFEGALDEATGRGVTPGNLHRRLQDAMIGRRGSAGERRELDTLAGDWRVNAAEISGGRFAADNAEASVAPGVTDIAGQLVTTNSLLGGILAVLTLKQLAGVLPGGGPGKGLSLPTLPTSLPGSGAAPAAGAGAARWLARAAWVVPRLLGPLLGPAAAMAAAATGGYLLGNMIFDKISAGGDEGVGFARRFNLDDHRDSDQALARLADKLRAQSENGKGSDRTALLLASIERNTRFGSAGGH